MVYLAYPGMQDMFLTESPKFTHFKTLYTRDIQSYSKVIEQPFDQQEVFRGDDTLIATFKQNGDFINNITLKVTLSNIVPTSQYYTYPDYLKFIGKTMSVFSSVDDTKLFDLSLNGLLATTENTNWATANVTLPGSTFISYANSKFDFSVGESTYAVFDDIEFANFWGFVFNPIQLFGGFVKFMNISQSQVTFQECGWLPGDQIYDSSYSYLEDTMYKMIQSVSLYIGKQLIQEFDSASIKFYKETHTSYKNRPVLKLLEGNDNIVDDNRIYYFDIPFISIPIHALPRHDVQVHLKLNKLNSINFYNAPSLIVNYNIFSVNLPKEYLIQVPQVSYFSSFETLDMRNHVKTIVINGSSDFKIEFNGEFYTDSVYSKSTTLDNFLNVPVSSNGTVVLKNPINMSRIRDQKFKSSNTMVYAESINFLKVSNDLSGLLFSKTESSGYPVVTGNLTNPTPTTQQTYIFDQIPTSVSSIQSFYSMRLTNTAYNGPVVRLRDPSTDIEADFYTDTTQSYLRTNEGVSIDNFPGRKVVVWYDQSLNKNHMTQYIKQLQPTLLKESESGLYTIGIFNNTTVQDSISPDCYMDITTPVHPQQFAIIAEFNALGTFNSPSTIFSTPNFTWRLVNGSVTGGSSPNAGDWVQWPESGSTTFKVNGTSQTTLSASEWYVITSYHTQTYLGSNVNVIGANSEGIYQIPRTSANAYVFEFSFLDNTTMSTDADSYFLNAPSTIVQLQYPLQALTGYGTTISGSLYGNGKYTVAVSSDVSGFQGWRAFGTNSQYWRSGSAYNTTTGVYTGSNIIGGYKGEYVTIQLPESIKLKKITTLNNFYTKTINVLGSTDGIIWKFLYKINRSGNSQSVLVNSETAYSFYAFVCEDLTTSNFFGAVFLSIRLFKI